jgi:YafQ family addiction module toxin component
MNCVVEFSSEFEKSMKKLKKTDKEMFLRIQKKLKDIVQHPNRYKNLKNVLAGYQRIHFGPFVLIFKVDEDTVRIISLDHHDKSY